jgi:hypothetical protein
VMQSNKKEGGSEGTGASGAFFTCPTQNGA